MVLNHKGLEKRKRAPENGLCRREKGRKVCESTKKKGQNQPIKTHGGRGTGRGSTLVVEVKKGRLARRPVSRGEEGQKVERTGKRKGS